MIREIRMFANAPQNLYNSVPFTYKRVEEYVLPYEQFFQRKVKSSGGLAITPSSFIFSFPFTHKSEVKEDG